ncbi:MAG: hypothetical protein ACFE0Q_05450 [Anaerolineae bacterium]
MLNITYAVSAEPTAQQIQRDLAQAGNLRLDHPMLLVLVTSEALTDAGVQSAIASEEADRANIALIMLEKISLPDSLKSYPSLDLSHKYDKQKLVQFVKRSDIPRERIAKNRRLLFYVGGTALLMFIISLASISAGIVAFPVDEYATENAIRDQQVATIVAPQIEQLRPRTTEDALNFEMTLEAVGNEDLLPFIAGTATAIPQQLQATNEARATQALLTESAQTQTAND